MQPKCVKCDKNTTPESAVKNKIIHTFARTAEVTTSQAMRNIRDSLKYKIKEFSLDFPTRNNQDHNTYYHHMQEAESTRWY